MRFSYLKHCCLLALALATVPLTAAAAAPAAAAPAAPTAAVTSFTAHVFLQKSGRLTVHQTFTYQPGAHSRSVISQSLPTTYSDDQGQSLKSTFTLLSASRDDHPLHLHPATTPAAIKFNFPLPSDHSPHTFTLSYVLEPIILAAPTADVFKFSATGLNWSVPINQAIISVNTSGLKTQNLTCYIGSQGSTTSDCRQTTAGDQTIMSTNLPLQPGDTLNLAAGFPSGSFVNYYNNNRVWIREVIIAIVLITIIIIGLIAVLRRLRQPAANPPSS